MWRHVASVLNGFIFGAHVYFVLEMEVADYWILSWNCGYTTFVAQWSHTLRFTAVRCQQYTYCLLKHLMLVSLCFRCVCVCVRARALCTGVLWICECNVAGKSHWIVWLCFHRHDIACRTTVKVICDYARITVTVELCRWLRLPFSVALRHWALAAPCFLWLSQQRWDQLDPLPCRTNKEKTQTSLQD